MSDEALRDSKGRMLQPLPGAAPPITSDTARDMVRRRQEKRMRLYAEGAQLAVDRRDLIEKYGEDAHIVERAISLQTIASTPDAGKAAVMADTALQKAQGYDDGKGAETVNNTVNVIALPDDVAQAIADMRRLLAERANSVEGKVNDE
jgi:hypothetical protein